ncbi:MAG: outer membrane protein transport protein [Polyangiaceae bacterium]|nr:outer membrane protein transport protein [Polyangiaceae bacterium]
MARNLNRPASARPARRRVAWAACALAWSWASAASGAGFATGRFGADHGNPMTANPYAVFFNPGAVGNVKGTWLTVDASIAYRRVDFTRDSVALSPSSSQPRGDRLYLDANTGDASAKNFAALPYLGVTSELGPLAIGLASYVPYGGAASWGKIDRFAGSTTAPGAVDGPQRWQIISGSQLAWYNTLAVAAKLPVPGLAVGASISYVRHSLVTSRARNADGSDDVRDFGGGLIEGRSVVDVSGANLAASVGVHYQPSAALRLGASYQSKPGFGQTRLSGTLRNQVGNLSDEQRLDVDLLQTLPDVLLVGGAARVSADTEVRLDANVTRWSAFDRQCVVAKGRACTVAPDGSANLDDVLVVLPRRWRDSYGARLGASVFVDPTLEVFGSAAIDTSAVPASTLDASYPDALKIFGTIGAKKTWREKYSVAASYNHVYFSPVSTAGRSEYAAGAPPSRSPRADGRYDQSIVYVNLNASVRFR